MNTKTQIGITIMGYSPTRKRNVRNTIMAKANAPQINGVRAADMATFVEVSWIFWASGERGSRVTTVSDVTCFAFDSATDSCCS